MKLPVEWILERVPLKADAEEIADRLTMAGFEVEGKGDSARGPVLDIKVTPNRGDGLSVIGVARELSAAYGAPMTPPAVPANPPRPAVRGQQSAVSSQQSARSTQHSALSTHLVAIEAPDLCPRYAARVIRNVIVGPAPDWIRERVEAAGMRSINNVVDVTNYVMLETGQPLHAFDFDTLEGHRIIVRRARAGEALQTLDGTERALTGEMLVIADSRRAVALAGIMGGAETEMTESTTTVLLESAHFHPLSVRRTARALDMSTEASYRFQRYVDPAAVASAAERACQLLAQIGAGDVEPDVVDVYPLPAAERVLGVRPERVTAMLGFTVTDEQVIDCLQRLGFSLQNSTLNNKHSELTFVAPSWRPDIVREIDLVEEVGRVLGYEHIPEKLPAGRSTQGRDSDIGAFAQRVRLILAGAGLQEIVSHSLLAPTPLEDPREAERRVGIRSALSAELSGLRRSLLPGLLDGVERNLRRGNSPLAFFEIGRVFDRSGDDYSEKMMIGGVLGGPLGPSSWDRSSGLPSADFYTVRGLVERLADSLHIEGMTFERSADPRLHPGRSADVLLDGNVIGYFGEIHPWHSAELRTRERVIVFGLMFDALMAAAGKRARFLPFASVPAVTRDIAPRLPEETPYGQVEQAVRSADAPFLVQVRVTDVYVGQPLPEGTKSLTLSLTFRAPDRTLTEGEVNDMLNQIRAALEADCGASFAA